MAGHQQLVAVIDEIKDLEDQQRIERVQEYLENKQNPCEKSTFVHEWGTVSFPPKGQSPQKRPASVVRSGPGRPFQIRDIKPQRTRNEI